MLVVFFGTDFFPLPVYLYPLLRGWGVQVLIQAYASKQDCDNSPIADRVVETVALPTINVNPSTGAGLQVTERCPAPRVTSVSPLCHKHATYHHRTTTVPPSYHHRTTLVPLSSHSYRRAVPRVQPLQVTVNCTTPGATVYFTKSGADVVVQSWEINLEAHTSLLKDAATRSEVANFDIICNHLQFGHLISHVFVSTFRFPRVCFSGNVSFPCDNCNFGPSMHAPPMYQETDCCLRSDVRSDGMPHSGAQVFAAFFVDGATTSTSFCPASSRPLPPTLHPPCMLGTPYMLGTPGA